MTAIQACEKVYSEHQVHLIRQRKDEHGQYDVKEAFQGKKKGWFYLDSFTASAVVKVYRAVNDGNKEKLAQLPIERLASISFKMIS
jgi:hypothetical protein